MRFQIRHLYWILTGPSFAVWVEEPSHVKQLSLNHMCRIGLNSITHLIIEQKRAGGADNYERTAG